MKKLEFSLIVATAAVIGAWLHAMSYELQCPQKRLILEVPTPAPSLKPGSHIVAQDGKIYRITNTMALELSQ